MENIYKIPFPGLLDEMVNWADTKSLEMKVSRIIHLCMKQGHEKLAMKIAAKYDHLFTKHDIVIATGFALQAMKKLNEDAGSNSI